MWVALKIKEKSGKCFRLKKKLTVKEAMRYFKKELKNDDDIVKVWLTHFNGWHECLHKILKDDKK